MLSSEVATFPIGEVAFGDSTYLEVERLVGCF